MRVATLDGVMGVRDRQGAAARAEAAFEDRAILGLVARLWAVLAAATLAFAAALGFVRFGFGLVLPAMRDGLGLSSADMGVIAGCSFAAYLVCSLPAGALATRLGSRRVVGGQLASSDGSFSTSLLVAGGADLLGLLATLAVRGRRST